jgi:hypothetical protein
MNNWITKNYPKGSQILVPHPSVPYNQPCVVVNHTVDNVSRPIMSKGPTGIMVRFDDGVYIEVEQGYLNEDGGGVV